jgi:hypothetical protein
MLRRDLLTLLVPKLGLGTQVGKLCFPDRHAAESIGPGR